MTATVHTGQHTKETAHNTPRSPQPRHEPATEPVRWTVGLYLAEVHGQNLYDWDAEAEFAHMLRMSA